MSSSLLIEQTIRRSISSSRRYACSKAREVASLACSQTSRKRRLGGGNDDWKRQQQQPPSRPFLSSTWAKISDYFQEEKKAEDDNREDEEVALNEDISPHRLQNAEQLDLQREIRNLMRQGNLDGLLSKVADEEERAKFHLINASTLLGNISNMDKSERARIFQDERFKQLIQLFHFKLDTPEEWRGNTYSIMVYNLTRLEYVSPMCDPLLHKLVHVCLSIGLDKFSSWNLGSLVYNFRKLGFDPGQTFIKAVISECIRRELKDADAQALSELIDGLVSYRHHFYASIRKRRMEEVEEEEEEEEDGIEESLPPLHKASTAALPTTTNKKAESLVLLGDFLTVYLNRCQEEVYSLNEFGLIKVVGNLSQLRPLPPSTSRHLKPFLTKMEEAVYHSLYWVKDFKIKKISLIMHSYSKLRYRPTYFKDLMALFLQKCLHDTHQNDDDISNNNDSSSSTTTTTSSPPSIHVNEAVAIINFLRSIAFLNLRPGHDFPHSTIPQLLESFASAAEKGNVSSNDFTIGDLVMSTSLLDAWHLTTSITLSDGQTTLFDLLMLKLKGVVDRKRPRIDRGEKISHKYLPHLLRPLQQAVMWLEGKGKGEGGGLPPAQMEELKKMVTYAYALYEQSSRNHPLLSTATSSFSHQPAKKRLLRELALVEGVRVVKGDISINQGALIINPMIMGGSKRIAVLYEERCRFLISPRFAPSGTLLFQRILLDIAQSKGEIDAWISVPWYEWRNSEVRNERDVYVRKKLVKKGLDLKDFCRWRERREKVDDHPSIQARSGGNGGSRRRHSSIVASSSGISRTSTLRSLHR